MQMRFESLYRYIASLPYDGIQGALEEVAATGSFVDDDESAAYDEDSRVAEMERIRLRRFTSCLFDAIDLDGNRQLDDVELQRFGEVLKCSSITSVGNGDDEAGERTEEDWNYRSRMKGYAARVKDEASVEFRELVDSRWKSRLKYPRKVFKAACIDYESKPNTFAAHVFECMLAQEEDSTFTIILMVWSCGGRKNREAFNVAFGEKLHLNPFAFLGKSPDYSDDTYIEYRVANVPEQEIESRAVELIGKCLRAIDELLAATGD